MNVLFEQLLYRINSNKTVGSWAIAVTENNDGSANILTTQTKLIGGKGVESVTTVSEGKNMGKKNETTSLEQAVINAKATADKKLKKGYLLDVPSGEEQVTNSLGLLKPMLAQTIEKVKNWEFPVFASPKLDGHRLLATVQENKVLLYSRQGTVVSLPHIEKELQQLFDDKIWSGVTLDGEVYLHEESLQIIGSLVKNTQPETANLKYYLYDVIDNQHSYKQRLSYLEQIASNTLEALVVIKTEVLSDIQEVNLFHSNALSDGYEGSMLRWSSASYEDGKRSKFLMKKKDFQDAEFKVVDVIAGKTVTRNGNTYELPIYVCATAQGEKFNCVAAGTLQDKHQAWLDKTQAIGKQLTVKFFNYTDNNIPFLPVALRLRNDI